MTVIDAGASIGQYAMLASARVGPRGSVHCFEPHPGVHRVLRRNLRRAGCVNVLARRLALGRTSGVRDLFLHPIDNVGATSFAPRDAMRPGPRVRAATTTLDAYVETHGLRRVDLVRIDVEGAELEVLDGATHTLDANPDIVLVVQFLRESARRFGYTVEDLEARLRALGFRLFSITKPGLRSYTPVGERAVNVVASRRIETLLHGLSDSAAALLLVSLAGAPPSTPRDRPAAAVARRRSAAASPPAVAPGRYVISRRSAGIGDLLVNLLVAWRFALYTGRTLVADWRFSTYMEDRRRNLFPALFEPIEDLAGVPLLADDRVAHTAFPEPLHPPSWTRRTLAAPRARRAEDIFADRDAAVTMIRASGDVAAPTVVFDACINDALPPSDACRRVLALLEPVAAVREAVDDFRQTYLADRPVVAVHIRYGNGASIDNDHAPYWADFDAGIRRCVAAARAARHCLGRGAVVFLATDSRVVVDAFRAQMADVVMRPKLFRKDRAGELHWWSLGFLTRAAALVDMLLLAEGHALVRYPPGSFFSFYASLLKKAPPPSVAPHGAAGESDPLAPRVMW
jgi:FkbM family methyltransferase